MNQVKLSSCDMNVLRKIAAYQSLEFLCKHPSSTNHGENNDLVLCLMYLIERYGELLKELGKSFLLKKGLILKVAW